MLSDVDRFIIWTSIGIFNVIGLFGNCNVIYAHYRLPLLRTKYICLLYEWVGILYALSGDQILRASSPPTQSDSLPPTQSDSLCFRLLAPYIFMHCIQSGLMAAISTDLLLSITIPIRHRLISMQHYLLLFLIPILCYAISVLVLAAANMDEEPGNHSSVPASAKPSICRLWYFVALLLNGIVVITYICTFALIERRRRTKKRVEDELNVETKALRSLSVLLLVFLSTRFCSTAISNIMNFAGASRDAIDWVRGYAIIPALACYSSTFYVCILRSREYRKIFSAQIAGFFAVFGLHVDRHFLYHNDYKNKYNDYSLRYRSNRSS